MENAISTTLPASWITFWLLSMKSSIKDSPKPVSRQYGLAPLVEGALYAENPDGSHRCGDEHADGDPSPYHI